MSQCFVHNCGLISCRLSSSYCRNFAVTGLHSNFFRWIAVGFCAIFNLCFRLSKEWSKDKQYPKVLMPPGILLVAFSHSHKCFSSSLEWFCRRSLQVPFVWHFLLLIALFVYVRVCVDFTNFK